MVVETDESSGVAETDISFRWALYKLVSLACYV